MGHDRPSAATAAGVGAGRVGGGGGGGAAAAAVATAAPARVCRARRQQRWPLLARAVALLAVVVLIAAPLPHGARSVGTAPRVKRFPRGAFPSVGRVPRVCSLQCHTGPLANGDTAYEAGGNLYPWGNDTCRSPLDPLRALYLSDADPDASAGVRLHEAALRLRLRVLARTLGSHRARQIALDVQYRPSGPLRRGVCGGEGGLVREESVVNVLTLLRNSMQGGVARHIGKYDVIGYTRVSAGVCGTDACEDVTAVDTTGAQTCGAVCVEGSGCSCQGTTVLTTVGPDGEERSISMQQHRYLSLGRGLLAQTDWLGEHRGIWNLTALLQLYSGWDSPDGKRPQLRQPAMARMIASLSGVRGTLIPKDLTGDGFFPRLANTTTTWPQLLAGVVCMDPIQSFVRDRTLCLGMPASKQFFESATLVGRRFFGKGNAFAMTSGWAKWCVFTLALVTPPINATPAIFQRSPYERASMGPAVEPLAAYGLREVHSASPNERAVAASIRRRLLYLPSRRGEFVTSPESSYHLMATRLHDSAQKDIERLSSAYDRSTFDVDEPPEPATAQDVVLAVLVILPEATAMVVALLATRTWGRRECVAVGMVFAVGLASLSALISLAVTERRGADWRVSSERTALGARFPVGIDNTTLADVRSVLTGTELAYAETYLIAARTGYHPALLLWLAVGFSAAYVVVSAGSAAYIVRAWRREAAAAAARAHDADADAWGADDRVPVVGGRGRSRRPRRWWRPLGTRRKAAATVTRLPADGPGGFS